MKRYGQVLKESLLLRVVDIIKYTIILTILLVADAVIPSLSRPILGIVEKFAVILFLSYKVSQYEIQNYKIIIGNTIDIKRTER